MNGFFSVEQNINYLPCSKEFLAPLGVTIECVPAMKPRVGVQPIESAVVNFTNILRSAFACAYLKSIKRLTG